jgi:hypothetical protein
MKLLVMPHFGDGGESFLNQYAGLVPPEAHGFRGVVETLVGNPVFTESVALEREKVAYVLELLVPLLFLPVARPIGLVLAFERAAARGPGRLRALAAGVVAASLACSYLYGAVLQQDTARGGFDRFRFGTTSADLARRASLDALVAEIPPDARVSASEHLVPHVSGRENAYTLRFGLRDADYMLLQLPLRGDEHDPTGAALRDGSFGVVDDRGELVLAKRGESTARNASVLSRCQ